MCGRDRAIWNRDIDKLADPELLTILSKGTGTNPERAFETTLAAYQNTLYLDHNPYGNTQWIMPLGVYHRLRRGNGMQYCPQCLAAKPKEGQPIPPTGPDGPYFRRKWRLGFVVACVEHELELLDCCPVCDSPVCFHRREMGQRSSLPDGNIGLCSNCNHDLARSRTARISEDELEFHRFLQDGLTNGWMLAPDERPVYAHLYFTVLHQIMKLLVSKRSRGLGSIVSNESGIEGVPIPRVNGEIEKLPVPERRRLLLQARWLLADWPNRFVRLCKDNDIWSAWILRDMKEAPYWFASVVQRELYVRFAPFDAAYNRRCRRFKEKQDRARIAEKAELSLDAD